MNRGNESWVIGQAKYTTGDCCKNYSSGKFTENPRGYNLVVNEKSPAKNDVIINPSQI